MKEKQLRRAFPNLKISRDRSYRELTSLGVGSAPLPLLAEPEDKSELIRLIRFLRRRRTKWFLFGAGTNLVGMDTPYPGVGIRPSGSGFTSIEFTGNRVRCGSFVKLPALAALAAKRGLGGLGPLSGIPGSIGGALRMNAGACGSEICSLVRELDGVRADGTSWHADAEEIEWVYRGSSVPPDVIITSAVLELQESEVAKEEALISAEIESRRNREPAGRSAGCAFRNVSDLEPAGKLIDQCGLRGFRVGDLLVSEKHANYLLNVGCASEADYLRMIRILRRAVSEKYGFYLTTEIVPVDPAVPGDIEADTPAPRINVLYGGTSSEREISLQSGSTVAAALRHAGFKVDLTDIRRCAVTPTMRESDVVYPVLHGGFGEGGALQKLLEEEHLRFVGSGSNASFVVMDKLASKRLMDEVKLPTARWKRITRADRNFPSELKLPLMIKAPCEGSTVGIVKVNSEAEWESALDSEFKFSDELLVEEFISGVEITVPVLNAVALEPIEIVSPSGFYDWDAKYVYKNGQTEYFCPPRSLPPETVQLAKELALKFYHAARCRDILRVDFIIGNDGIPRILEGNSLPGNTSHSLVPKAARQAGISMERMTATLVYAAMKRSGIPEYGEEFSSVSPGLMRFCRALFYLVLLIAGVLLMLFGIDAGLRGNSPWPLCIGGAMLILSIPEYMWFKRLEKK